MRKIIKYRKDLKQISRKLRKHMTLSEVLLWNKIKNKQLLGYDFDRQRPINNYVVDFYCKDLKLAIEIDGNSHSGDEKYFEDIERENNIKSLGVDIIRFSDIDAKRNMSGVLEALELRINNINEGL
ncbi:MAG: endonuclease domain-containing protein [Ignavibacteria bacterium]